MKVGFRTATKHDRSMPSDVHLVVISVLFVFSCLAFGRLTDAQENHSLSAAEVANSGEQATRQFQEGNATEAFAIWERLLKHANPEHRKQILFNMGKAHYELSHYRRAWHFVRQAQALDAKEEIPATQALELIERELKGKYVLVHIRCEPSGAKLAAKEINEGETMSCPLDWWLAPGVHRVTLSREGWAPQLVVVTVDGKVEGTSLVMKMEPPTPIPSPPVRTADQPHWRSPFGSWEWYVASVGVGLLAAGGATHITAFVETNRIADSFRNQPDTKDVRFRINEAMERDVDPWMTATWSLYALGGAAVAVGVTGLIWNGLNEDGNDGTDHASWFFQPSPTGAVLGWTF